MKWFHKAAEQNLASAQSNLGFCCTKARGVPKDETEGYKWMLLAAAQGDEYAKKQITTLEGTMSQEQISEGQKRAGNFKPSDAKKPSALGNAILLKNPL